MLDALIALRDALNSIGSALRSAPAWRRLALPATVLVGWGRKRILQGRRCSQSSGIILNYPNSDNCSGAGGSLSAAHHCTGDDACHLIRYRGFDVEGDRSKLPMTRKAVAPRKARATLEPLSWPR